VFSGTMRVDQPRLWSIRKPYLHTLVVRLMEGGRAVDERRLRIGIRTLRADPKLGFFLNGEHMVPSGANRHQAYPYIGNALSDQAQYRDARLLKEAGFEIIRLSHYPQAPAFMDACDELGMITIQCIPGWQFFNSADEFKNNVRQNLRDLIRRDRNHPCAVLWECSLNETPGHDSFIRQLVELAHAEYPGVQMLTCGDTEGHDYNQIRYEVPYSGWDAVTETRPDLAHGMMSLHREYGDNQFGGYSRYSRGDGEQLMLVQAWNYQTAMNDQLGLDYTWGQCIWEAIDNCRGMSPEIATCGALDQFRLPKFMYEFYRSQRNPDWLNTNFDSGPMVFIANYWMEHSTRDVIVFSNCDEIRLIVNGREVARRRPDSGPDVAFGDHSGFDLNYWMHNANSVPPRDVRMKQVHSPVYNGGNCHRLPHPPFTFPGLHFEPGELKALGYRNGCLVASHMRRTPGLPERLRLRVATRGCAFVGDGSDIIIVHAEICDPNGTVVPDATHGVRFNLDGPGRWIGDNPRRTEAGVASVLLRSTGGLGRIHLRASTWGLHEATLTITPMPNT
jgi:beta-galactosidase